MNNNYYDLYYTFIENGDGKEIVIDKHENDYINFIDILPNLYVGRKNNIELLR